MTKLLSIGAGKQEITKAASLQAEPVRAIYYGVFFRDRNGRPQVATDNFYDQRADAERFVDIHAACKPKGTNTDCVVGTLSLPVSAEETGKCLAGI
ncbi:MAG: hypothetical protein P4K93_09740 [Terracidiphilus sp.]|nr:hypothetical protein [Terracidiphilus sp.]